MNERETFWDIGDVLMFLGLGVPVFLVAFAVTGAPLLLWQTGPKAVRLLVPQMLAYGAALLPLWWIFHSRYGEPLLPPLRLHVAVRAAAVAFNYGILTAVGISILGVLLRTPNIDTPMMDLLQDPLSIAVVAVLGSTIGPLFEELYFRGFLQPALVRRLGVAVGVISAALPFALLHGPQYSWSWRHLLVITLAGALFGWHRHRTGSTGAAAIMHAAYNLTLFVAFLAGRALGIEQHG